MRLPAIGVVFGSPVVGQLPANESHAELEDRQAPRRKAFNRKDRKELPPSTQRKKSLNAKS
jgi:hypothetical protein